MIWGFELYLLVFLLIVMVSQWVANISYSLLPMPLVFGVLLIIGGSMGILPKEMSESANMLSVGMIAYNLFVVNAGASINIGLLIGNKKKTLLCLAAMIVTTAFVGCVMPLAIGNEAAILSSGTSLGGGAACAIASIMSYKIKPMFSVLPWMIFMFQGIVSTPVILYCIKKMEIKFEGNSKRPNYPERKTLVSLVPKNFKTTAYYLASIMAITYVNKLVFSFLGTNSVITALILGFVAAQLGLIDPSPLSKADSFGLLLLGLMGLMANTMLNTPAVLILSLVPIAIVVAISACVVLAIVGAVGAKYIGTDIYTAVMITVNCMMGYPANDLYIKYAVKIKKVQIPLFAGQETGYEDIGMADVITSKIAPNLAIGTMLISQGLSIIAVCLAPMIF